MKSGGVFLAAGVCVFCSLGTIAQQEKNSASAFRWLDDKKDSEVLAVLQKEFRAELAPGEQNKPRSLRRVGVFGNSAIVQIDTDETEIVEGERHYDYFSAAYNFNFVARKKNAISSIDKFWKWTLLKLSRFEAGAAPDIVFTYWTCTDCEAEHALGSFRYDAESKEWSVWRWDKSEKGMNNEAIFIGSTTQNGDSIFRYATIFKVQDFDGDHFDDVMVWSREKAYEWENESKLHSAKDTFVVYSIRAGRPIQSDAKGSERRKLQNMLCAGNKIHELCRAANRRAATQ